MTFQQGLCGYNIAYLNRNCLVIKTGRCTKQSKQPNNCIYTTFMRKDEPIADALRSKMCLKESPTMLSKYHKIQQINNSEQCQWPRAFHGFSKSMYLISPRWHNCCSVSVAGSVGRLWLCCLNWSWRRAPEGSEQIEPDSQSAAGNRPLVVPRLLVVTQCTWAMVGRHRADGPNGRPWCPLRWWNTGHLWFGRRKHWRPAQLSMRLRQAEIRGQGYSLGCGWDYWLPRGLHYLSQHHANRTRLRETEDWRWSAAAAAATAEIKAIVEHTIFVKLINRVLT